MIVAWSWLKDYVDLDMPVEALVDRLMMSGLNHESTSDAAGDIAIDLEVTSNRPDCLGHLGIAREVAAIFQRPWRMPAITLAESETSIESLTKITLDSSAAEWCPQYRARVIEGVKVGPSPAWLARRLEAVGQTPINNIVDVTNYVMLECGQPLHAFDLDALAERQIIVRAARRQEPFLAINNKTYELREGMGVIADARRPVALAGVMGGKESEISGETSSILLESAEFLPLAVRNASRSLDLSSDSSYRFERRIDPMGVAWASDRACRLIAELSGGRVARGYLHVGRPAAALDEIPLRHQRVRRILGIDVSMAECVRILQSLGVEIVAESKDGFVARPPSFRRDLTREIDLIEEIGRIHGYHDVPQDRIIPLGVAPVRKERRVMDRVRQVLVGSGFHEAVTFSFSDRATATSVRPWSSEEPIELRHSSRKQENRLRQSLIPSLLHAARLNESRGNEDIRLFEVASIYLSRQAGLPFEPRSLGLVATGDVRTLRGVLECLFERLRVPVVFAPVDIDGFAPGQAAEYRIAERRIGVLGVIAPAVRDSIDMRGTVVAAELLLEAITEAARLDFAVRTVPDQPAVARDLAVVLDEQVRWSELEAVVVESAGPLLESHRFIDLYRGKQIDPGKKSIAFRMTFRAPDRTLTHEEVDKVIQSIVGALADRLSGRLRV